VGLTTALVLCDRKDAQITVIAKHMPGDYDIEYTSPWAGANYFPVGKPGTLLQSLEKATWQELDRICRSVPEAGIHYQETKVYGRLKDRDSATGQWFEELVKEDAWFKDVVPNVSALQLSTSSYSSTCLHNRFEATSVP
jgi:D-amino-acid oxidase